MELEIEIRRREELWQQLVQQPDSSAIETSVLQSLRIYRGQAGVWVDKAATGALADGGIAVALRHTGRHYTDVLEADYLIYDFPATLRSASHDEGEIKALINACKLQVPVFVVVSALGGRRKVYWARIADVDLAARCCIVQLDATELAFHADPQPQSVFEPMRAHRVRDIKEVARIERDPRFKFNALSRYGSVCALTDISVQTMLDAAHIVPVSEGGTDDVRNALLLSASVHRAFDAHLWAIEPETRTLATRKTGPTLNAMKIARSDIRHLVQGPASEALQIRWESFVDQTGNRFQLAS